MPKFTCKSCEAEIRASRLVLYLPSHIKCQRCSARHRARYAAAVGSVYLLLLGALTFGIKVFADRFEIRTGNTASIGPLQAVLELGAPLFALAIIGPIYVWALSRYFPLRLNGP